MPKKRKEKKLAKRQAAVRSDPPRHAPPDAEAEHERLHLEELRTLAGGAAELAFLSGRLAELEKNFDSKKLLGYYHMAVATLGEENARLRARLEEFTVPSKSLQVAVDKEKEFLERKIGERELAVKEIESRYEKIRLDFEAFKRKSEKRIEEAAVAAGERFVLKLLPVLDNLERALSFKDASDSRSVIEGVGLIKRQIEEIFEREGIVRFDAEGAAFDPNLHEATESVETDAYPEDTVVEEIRKGYRFGQKVIRPALVKVAKALLSKKEEH